MTHIRILALAANAASVDFTAAYTLLGCVSIRTRYTHTHTANNVGKKDQRFTYMKIQLAYISFIVLRKGREKESTTVLSCMHMRTFYLLGILVQPTRDETVSGIGKKRLTSVRMVWDTANGM